MSLPRQPHMPSSSPSKSSLRRTSGSRNPSSHSLGPTTHFAQEATQHHFLPHSPPNQNLEFEEEDDEDGNEEAVEESGGSYSASQPVPPIQFQPFFTLIEDSANNEHYHPTVHYIFADDDAEIITEAACRSLEQEQDDLDSGSQSATKPQETEDEESEMESRLPRRVPGMKEHYMILDVHPTRHQQSTHQQHGISDPISSSPVLANTSFPSWSYTVSSAQSLSSDWQILRTNISDAPTIGEQEVGDEGFMLRVEVRGHTPPESQGKDNKQEKESVEEMIERFQKRLSEIRQLVDFNGSGNRFQQSGGDQFDEPD